MNIYVKLMVYFSLVIFLELLFLLKMDRAGAPENAENKPDGIRYSKAL